MKLSRSTSLALIFLSISVGRAEEWTTNDGKTYKVISVSKYDNVGVTVLDKEGNYTAYRTIPLASLPPDLQKRFHYDPQSAATLKAQQDARALAAKAEADYQQQQNSLYKKARAGFDSTEESSVGGKVFITAQDGQVEELESVHVYLFSEEQARAAVTSLAEKAAAATQGLQPALDAQKAKCIKLKNAVDTYQGDPDSEEFKVLAQAYIEDLKRYRSILTSYYHYYSPAYYAAGLPTALADAKTDKNGQFSLQIPKTGSWVLGAYKPPDKSEGWFWLVKVGDRAGAGDNVSLNNGNLSTSDSGHSMAKTMDQSTIDQIITTADYLLKRAN
jgi:hypothetical protein